MVGVDLWVTMLSVPIVVGIAQSVRRRVTSWTARIRFLAGAKASIPALGPTQPPITRV
jgi:hypothetical protein